MSLLELTHHEITWNNFFITNYIFSIDSVFFYQNNVFVDRSKEKKKT